MGKIKVVWTRFGVSPGKIGGGTGTKRETTRRLSDRCDFYLMTHEAIYNWYREFGIEIKPFHLIKGRIGQFGSIPFLMYCILKCMFVRVNERFDVVAARNHDLWDLVPALCLKLQTKARLIVYIQARVLPEWGSRSILTWLIVWLERFLGLVLTRLFADAVIIRNSGDIPMLTKFGVPQSRIYVASHGINIEDIEKVRTPKEKIYDCVYFGRIGRGKGIFDLLDAWRIIRGKYPGARLLVFGPSSDKELEKVKKTIIKYELEQNVILLDTIMGIKRFEKVQESKVFAQPSYVDTFSYSIGEALACGLPAVVYDIRSLRAVWQNAVTYCKKGDTQEFARKLLELLQDDELYRFKAEQGRKFVTRYSWARAIEEEYAVMRRVLHDKTQIRK